MQFKTILQSFGENNLGYGPYIEIPKQLAEEFLKNTSSKRIKCTLNNSITIDRAISQSKGMYYILMNRDVIKTINCLIGDEVAIIITADESKYGVEISEEMQEVLYQDPEGSDLFHLLTPGKQRTLILVINKYKNQQLKIERSIIILNHLKNRNGQLDFEQLNEDFKNFKLK